MRTLSFSARWTPRLQACAARGGWRREVLLPAVGLLVLLGVLRPPVPANDITWRRLLGAAVLLLGFLMLLGAAVNIGQPVFHALGRLSGETLLALLFSGFWLLLRHKGLRYLAQWEAACC